MKIIRKTIACAMAAAVLLLSGCGGANSDDVSGKASETTSEATAKAVNTERHKVIIDTDTGSDDAAALILAATDKENDILGVTVLYGNAALEDSAKNALMTLEEYLVDYASPETRAIGEKVIAEQLNNIPKEKVRAIAAKYIEEIKNDGKRDFRF